jgi:hypothetical protein
MTRRAVAAEFAGAPGEPPERVGSELLWRLATRLYQDHDRGSGETVCAACGQAWPCSGRRLAELGLIRAVPAGGAD